jgi:dihydrodipicolinate synthase/N-acetylneuraminate lyase
MQSELETTLEALIDKHGLKTVVSALSNVCGEKAEHLRSNWQDKASARVWENAGKTLDRVSVQSAIASA